MRASAVIEAAVCAAIGTFAGPLHGGAPDRALDALDEIGSPDRAREWVRERVGAGGRIMGFGHAVYRTTDPRAALLRDIRDDIPADPYATASEIEALRLRLETHYEIAGRLNALSLVSFLR